MKPRGYSPYHGGHAKHSKRKLKLPKLSGGPKKWLLRILGIIALLLILCYLALGDLRFFANNFLRLGFFHKNYLIVLQNNYEVRPSGGFVTGYGEMSVTLGNPSDISFFNSYEIDTESYVTPPYPHEKLLKNEWYEGYTFRDANWDPHFPDSALTLVDFYQQKFPDKDVDGVIVMNFSMIEELVDELGGIELDGEKLTSANLFKELTDTVNDVDRHDETALLERKSVLGELAGPLLSKAKWRPLKSRAVIENALASKDMFLWFRSEGLQRRANARGWTNTLELPENSDFLHVNVANLGSKKADRYLIKEVFHHVNLRKEIPEVTTEITLRYPGEKNIYADDYKGYLRVYIPEGATVQSDVLGASVESEGAFKVIATELIIPAGSKSSISYTYQLPRTLLNKDSYNLRLAKQSGDNKRFTVTVESHEDSGIESETFQGRENRAMWTGFLENDLDLSLTTLPDESAPYPIEHVFENLNTIAIYWNEPISSSRGSDVGNYTITDLNKIDEVTTDTVKVSYAEVVDGSVVKLEVEGVTKQDLERYLIRISDIEDNAGNGIFPNPKDITVVQRITPPSVEEALDSATDLNLFGL